MPKSGPQADQTAPTEATASCATIACGVLGRKAATVSPTPTPQARSVAASPATWRRSSAQEISTGSAPSSTNSRAGRSSEAARKTCSAKFRVAPGNQRAPGIAASGRTAV